MNTEKPKVSVLMSVYNGEIYLREAIESVLKQTYKNFEFLIINDGSSDNSVEIINSYKDERIVLINNEQNLGLPASLNKGLNAATGKYIARMDCDDICLPQRFEKQVKYMEKNPQAGLYFTGGKVFGIPELNFTQSWTRHFEITIKDSVDISGMSYLETNALFLFLNPFCHPTVMMRKSLLQEHSLKYSETVLKSQDLELWLRCIDAFPIHFTTEKLIYYRRHFAQAGRAARKQQINFATEVRKEWLAPKGFSFSDDEYLLMVDPFKTFVSSEGKDFFLKYRAMLNNIINQNKQIQYFDQDALSSSIEKIYYNTCLKSTRRGYWACNELNNTDFYSKQTGLINNLEFIMHYVLGKVQMLLKRRSGKK